MPIKWILGRWIVTQTVINNALQDHRIMVGRALNIPAGRSPRNALRVNRGRCQRLIYNTGKNYFLILLRDLARLLRTDRG